MSGLKISDTTTRRFETLGSVGTDFIERPDPWFCWPIQVLIPPAARSFCEGRWSGEEWVFFTSRVFLGGCSVGGYYTKMQKKHLPISLDAHKCKWSCPLWEKTQFHPGNSAGDLFGMTNLWPGLQVWDKVGSCVELPHINAFIKDMHNGTSLHQWNLPPSRDSGLRQHGVGFLRPCWRTAIGTCRSLPPRQKRHDSVWEIMGFLGSSQGILGGDLDRSWRNQGKF